MYNNGKEENLDDTIEELAQNDFSTIRGATEEHDASPEIIIHLDNDLESIVSGFEVRLLSCIL